MESKKYNSSSAWGCFKVKIWTDGEFHIIGSTKTWTWIAGFRVQSADHYTLEPSVCMLAVHILKKTFNLYYKLKIRRWGGYSVLEFNYVTRFMLSQINFNWNHWISMSMLTPKNNNNKNLKKTVSLLGSLTWAVNF